MLEQVLEPLVGVLRRAEPRELAHGPEPPPVHAGLWAARVGEASGKAHVAFVLVQIRIAGLTYVPRSEQIRDGNPRVGVELGPAQGAFLHYAREVRLAPLCLRCPEAVLGRHGREITRVRPRRDPEARASVRSIAPPPPASAAQGP